MKWFGAYLSNRKQHVSVNGCSPEELTLAHSVPQASVPGLLLFLIFVNDLPNVSKHLTFSLFADDTNIYFESSDLLQIQKVVNRELRKVRKWLEANTLTSNIDKTNFVIFQSQQRTTTDQIVLRFGRKSIKQESCVKFFLAYGICVWGSAYATYIDPMFILQQKILKIITFNGSFAPLFDTL